MAHDRSKLPRWAQYDLERLEREVRALRERQASAAPGSNVRRQDPVHGDTYLPADSAVAFTLPYVARDGRPAEVLARIEGDRLRLSAGAGGLILYPHVSNVVAVAVEASPFITERPL